MIVLFKKVMLAAAKLFAKNLFTKRPPSVFISHMKESQQYIGKVK